jgi:competence protein ComEA
VKDWLIDHKISLMAAVFIALGGVYYFYGNDFGGPADTNTLGIEGKIQAEEKDTENNKTADQKEQSETIMVDVKGQIKQPGVYQANTRERVIDVVSRAGGLTDKADEGQVNFAEHVQDEMIIYIPAKGEEGLLSPVSTGGNPASAGSQKESKININKADETELQNLPGIGPAKAAAIIEYRNTSGPFKAVEDLKNISGIGDKTFEKLKDLIVI